MSSTLKTSSTSFFLKVYGLLIIRAAHTGSRNELKAPTPPSDPLTRRPLMRWLSRKLLYYTWSRPQAR